MGVEACRTAKHSGLLLAVLRCLLRGAEIGAGKHNRLHARCLCALDHLIKVGIERVMRKIGADIDEGGKGVVHCVRSINVMAWTRPWPNCEASVA